MLRSLDARFIEVETRLYVTQYFDYKKVIWIEEGRVSFWGYFVYTLFPIIIGIIISFPYDFSKVKIEKFNVSKFIIQGIPALVIAIPWGIPVFAFMDIYTINLIESSIFDSFLDFSSKLNTYSVIAGVWFGKILVDSIFLKNNTSTI